MPGKCFGPTDSVADTLTQIGTTYQMPPGDWEIYRLRIGYGNVVNAKSCSGHIHIVTVERSYDLAFGNGVGATTNGTNIPAEVLDTHIHVPGNTSLMFYVLQTDVSKDVTISAQFKPGGQNGYRTMAGGGASANADTAADTEESFTCSSKLTGCSFSPVQNGRIYKIRYAGTGVVDAKANSGKLTVIVPGQAGPYEYAVGSGPGGATLGTPAWADEIEIPDGIPVQAQGTITVNILTAEIVKSPVVSLEYW